MQHFLQSLKSYVETLARRWGDVTKAAIITLRVDQHMR